MKWVEAVRRGLRVIDPMGPCDSPTDDKELAEECAQELHATLSDTDWDSLSGGVKEEYRGDARAVLAKLDEIVRRK